MSEATTGLLEKITEKEICATGTKIIFDFFHPSPGNAHLNSGGGSISTADLLVLTG